MSTGLYNKYRVERTDGKPVDGQIFFVLRLDNEGDQKHVAACRAALETYAENIADHIPELASDLYMLLDDLKEAQ
ncbi:hypothetical protein [Allohahella sp. A8]|uniref:hypothetical protein n=1 Tax=Allohahella sp. A8 TaxID=3141461 RepID=UPI003A7F8355